MNIGQCSYDLLQAFGTSNSEVQSWVSKFLFIHKQGSGDSGYQRTWQQYIMSSLMGHSAWCPISDSGHK